jgi:hypothetical protein
MIVVQRGERGRQVILETVQLGRIEPGGDQRRDPERGIREGAQRIVVQQQA